METTFITIQDLAPDARILYTSESIVDILGYLPEDVVNHSIWDYFHPDELPYARARHERGVELDKAAVLSYCRMRSKSGQWVGCEVVFTVVYDVLVGCTSIYKQGPKSSAPAIRRIFSATPRDPRYQMLSHLSSKFSQPMYTDEHEARAAFFLNRYTRTLTIMYATNGLEQLLGISGDHLTGKSFYYCISPDCLNDAVRCLETAKANDSLAYLRFWWRDPRTDEYESEVGSGSSDDTDTVMAGVGGQSRSSYNPSAAASSRQSVEPGTSGTSSTGSSSNPPALGHDSYDACDPRQSSASASASSGGSPDPAGRQQAAPSPNHKFPLELEAVVSCTSDGLVVCLRKAAPLAYPEAQRLAQQAAAAKQLQPQHDRPHQQHHDRSHHSLSHTKSYRRGLFAAPWADGALPDPAAPAYKRARQSGPEPEPDSGLAHPAQRLAQTPAQTPAPFMQSIRDMAVFAWALVGINGSLAEHGRGAPHGDAAPRQDPHGVDVDGVDGEDGVGLGGQQAPALAKHRPADKLDHYGFTPDHTLHSDHGPGSGSPSMPSHMVDNVEVAFDPTLGGKAAHDVR